MATDETGPSGATGITHSVIKDAIMMGAALVVMADSAKAWLRKAAAARIGLAIDAQRFLCL